MTENIITRPEWQFIKNAEEFDPRGEPMVELAWEVAKIAHRYQGRGTGEPYINHIAAVASIVRDVFGVDDPQGIASAILHDVIEDCGDISVDQLDEISGLVGWSVDKLDLDFIADVFGERTALSVDGVTKLSSDKETVKKLLMQFWIELMSALDKLADRLHNMSTLGGVKEEYKRYNKSKETMSVYTHLAESLGIWVVKNKLEDMAFQYIDPEKYEEVTRTINSDERLSSDFIFKQITRWQGWLLEKGFDGRVEIRVKGYWEADKKREKLIEDTKCLHPDSFADVSDLLSIRILVNNLGDADQILGCLKREYINEINVDGRDDYITEPADNRYSAYHEAISIDGNLVEIAITTEEKERYNNWGVVSLIRDGVTDLSEFARIMVFSPNDELHFLQRGATGVDYAVAISPSLLAQGVGMILDGEMVDIRSEIPNAASVYIVRDEQRIAADLDCVDYCVTLAAKREIIRQQERLVHRDLVKEGKIEMERILADKGLFCLEDLPEDQFDRARFALNADGDMDQLYTRLGAGTFRVEKVLEKLDNAEIMKVEEDVRRTSIRVIGPDIMGAMRYATTEIENFGGTISFSTNRADGSNYEARFVIRGLSEGSEAKLIESLDYDGKRRFVKIEVV